MYGYQGPMLKLTKGQVETDSANGTAKTKGGTKGHCVTIGSYDTPIAPCTDYHYPSYGRINKR